ncbi:putative H(+)-transporting two-sector ATPase [Helianthus anomalus]
MPQLDKFTYFTQFFWSCLFLFTFYIAICNDGDGLLGISRILKLRNQLLSHRANNIRSKDHNSLEDILRKDFSTGLSYMYSSLFEVQVIKLTLFTKTLPRQSSPYIVLI